MCSLRMVQMRRKPLLMDLAFAEFGWRSGRLCKSIFLELGYPRRNSYHLFRVCLPWLLHLCRSTLLASQSAQRFESFRFLESQSLVRCGFSSTSRHGRRIIFLHLSTYGTRSATPIQWKRWMWPPRTSFAALALSLLGTFFTLWLAALLLRSFGTC